MYPIFYQEEKRYYCENDRLHPEIRSSPRDSGQNISCNTWTLISKTYKTRTLKLMQNNVTECIKC